MMRKRIVAAVLLLASAILLHGQQTRGSEAALPPAVAGCLAKHPELEINRQQRPAYLKVRFRSVGEPDYLVAVVYREKHSSRALVCQADGSTQVLGVPGAQPFSEMYDDDYMSSEWRRCTRSELQRMARYYRGVPATENESVCLTWEDGEALIYERAGRLLWKSLKP